MGTKSNPEFPDRLASTASDGGPGIHLMRYQSWTDLFREMFGPEHHFREENPSRFSKSLHEFEQYSDGARGFGVGIPMVRRVALPDPPPPPFKTERDWESYYLYCGWDAIVRATHVDSTPILTSKL